MKKRVVVTGIGAVTPIGIGVQNYWEASLRGDSGTDELTLFDASNFETKIASEIKNFDASCYMLPEVFRKIDRFAQIGIAASKLAIDDAGVENQFDKNNNNIPVIVGSGLGGSLFHEEQIFKLVENKNPRHVLSSSVPRIAPNAVTAYIAMQHKFRGPNIAISTACSSGGNAMAFAAQSIENGCSEMAITGGVECPITPFTYAAYQSLRVLSKGLLGKKKSPRPFDKNRDGFVLGEGGVIFVLEEFEKAKARGARIYAEFVGYSSNCGVYHMAAPDPSGEDAAAVIEAALQHAMVDKRQVDFISAHGTATQANDVCEAKAINLVFGDAAKRPYVSSTKSQVGHTIGAAGAFGAMASILAIHNDLVPPSINCEELDENCNLNIPSRTMKQTVRYSMSNSFGFGSNNCALIFGKAK
jgi:3-oxoacyl-[acyl-carrier-protein] synthase II